MTLIEDICKHFKGVSPLDEVNGPWQDRTTRREYKYPYCIISLLASSGRVKHTFDATKYENADVRFEIFCNSQDEADAKRAAVESRFDKARFNLDGAFLGLCYRTGSYTRYAGMDNEKIVYVATVTYRLNIQR